MFSLTDTDKHQIKRWVSTITKENFQQDWELSLRLEMLIDIAVQTFLQYTNRTSVPYDAIPVIAELVIKRYNRLGFEGIDSTTYSGIHESFSDVFTDAEKAMMMRWRKVKML